MTKDGIFSHSSSVLRPIRKMETRPDKDYFFPATVIILIVVVLAAYIPFFFSERFYDLPLWHSGLMVGLGLAYAGIALAGYQWGVDRTNLVNTIIYYTVLLALTTGAMVLSINLGGALWLLYLPIVGESVALPRTGTVAVTSAVIIIVALIFWQVTSPLNALANVVSMASAMGFVLVFSYIAIREGQTRAEMQTLAGELGQANQKLRNYASQAEELATIRERNRLAREIHDTLGHYLTTINMQLKAAEAVFENNPDKSLDAIRKAQGMSQEGLNEVRNSVAALRESPLNEQSIAEAIKALVAEAQTLGIETDLRIDGTPRPVDPKTKLTLYRTVQEGLTNIRKHAQASRVLLKLSYAKPDEIALTIADNGVGADNLEGGFGLLGLRERVQILGGDVHFATIVGQGFTLAINLPG